AAPATRGAKAAAASRKMDRRREIWIIRPPRLAPPNKDCHPGICPPQLFRQSEPEGGLDHLSAHLLNLVCLHQMTGWHPSGMRICGCGCSGGVGAMPLNHRLMAVNPTGSGVLIPEG